MNSKVEENNKLICKLSIDTFQAIKQITTKVVASGDKPSQLIYWNHYNGFSTCYMHQCNSNQCTFLGCWTLLYICLCKVKSKRNVISLILVVIMNNQRHWYCICLCKEKSKQNVLSLIPIGIVNNHKHLYCICLCKDKSKQIVIALLLVCIDNMI